MVGVRRREDEMSSDHKYEVEVVKLERALRVRRELKKKIEDMLGKSTVRKFAKDAVDCPVLGKRVSFIFCYACPNFVRRYRGVVHCRGDPLPPDFQP